MNGLAEHELFPYYLDDDFDCAAECLDENVVEEESAWTRATIFLLLDECLKKKMDLLNPRHRRARFFSQIREELLAKGFVFSVKTLEKKFYNLKKTFQAICQNRDRRTGPGKPVTWPYYEHMMGIFAEELDIEDAPTMASLYPDPPLPKNAIILQTFQTEPDPVEELEAEYLNPRLQADDEDNGDGEETPWSHKSVLAFLQECCAQKYDLWDPMIRRRQIFTEIRKRLAARGFRFYQESLDRKLRNMKKQFQLVSESLKKKNGSQKRRRYTWPYYEQLKEIYGKEMEREVKRKRGVQKKQPAQVEEVQPLPTTSKKYRRIAPKPSVTEQPQTEALEMEIDEKGWFLNSDEVEKHPPSPIASEPPTKLAKIEIKPPSPGGSDRSRAQPHELLIADSVCDPKSPECTPSAQGDTSGERLVDFEVNFSNKSAESEERLKIVAEILEFEERRTIVAEEMANELAEANKINEKRLEFHRIKLEYALARRRQKKNGAV